MTQVDQSRAFGVSGVVVPPLGGGTNRWGAAQGKTNEAVFQAFQTDLDAGLNFFDTAEVYTGGNSERLLGECIRRDRRPVIIASKFAPLPTRLSPHTLIDALDASLQRLGVQTLDLYLVHWPFTFLSIDALMDMLALAVRSGKVRAVGVSNYNANQMRRAAARLARYDIPLAANEVHYSLLHRRPEANGVLETCRELNVALIAYRPLQSGQLVGKVPPTTSQLPVTQSRSNVFSYFRKAERERIEALQRILSTIALAHEKTISQVALRWLLQRDERVLFPSLVPQKPATLPIMRGPSAGSSATKNLLP